ncbi:hypothetical protein LV84_00471 [Algoriphagus ratkowskyi]|uniref:Uncharacterized protein n=1 Tax=Algoriphagus ratkowskyi TaxID=57028 RepID=A0A2W7RIX2_9BACT|nr:hypothetical protein [Algoriphagus ratkowskyi]PZX60201.1 hypothetical protein LV84_00471 [Algoriphagus ratkowskyi]TXD78027.1 hypothetical protein ESW18_08230 [Algoriphagus ratkowskyi]
MKITKNQNESFSVLHEHTHAYSQYQAGLKAAEKGMNKVAQAWNALEVGKFDQESLEKIYDIDYFKNKYAGIVQVKVDKIDLPKALKERIFADSIESETYTDLILQLEALYRNGNSWCRIPSSGGTRSFEVNVSYFQVKEGIVSIVPNIEGLTKPQFQILGDSPEKIEAFEKLNEAAKALTEATRLLEETGVFSAYSNPLIEQSPLFDFQDKGYVLNLGILL